MASIVSGITIVAAIQPAYAILLCTPVFYEACPDSLYLTVNTAGPNSLSGDPTSITAALSLGPTGDLPSPDSFRLPLGIPGGTTTLQEAAADLGFQSFEWIQQITSLPLPTPVSECANTPPCNASGAPTNPLSTPPSFNDPPPNGYNYFTTDYDPYPFYYNLSDVLSNPNLCIDSTASGCMTTLGGNSTSAMNFYDAPADYCIGGTAGTPSVGYNELANAGATLPCAPPTLASGAIDFTTALVGVYNNFVPGTDCLALDTCVDLDEFSWTDNFNGLPSDAFSGTGGISDPTSILSSVPVDPDSGTGGIIIVSENEPVPEPSTILLFVSSIIVFGTLKTSRRWIA